MVKLPCSLLSKKATRFSARAACSKRRLSLYDTSDRVGCGAELSIVGVTILAAVMCFAMVGSYEVIPV